MKSVSKNTKSAGGAWVFENSKRPRVPRPGSSSIPVFSYRTSLLK